jgi:hypothetical protein
VADATSLLDDTHWSLPWDRLLEQRLCCGVLRPEVVGAVDVQNKTNTITSASRALSLSQEPPWYLMPQQRYRTRPSSMVG